MGNDWKTFFEEDRIDMRRLLAAVINWAACLVITIIIRFVLAVPQRFVLSLERPLRLIDPWFPKMWYMLLVVPFFVSCFYYFILKMAGNRATIGERLIGIRIITKWRIWHGLFEGIAVVFFPFTILFFWLTGRMPYDRLLKIQVGYRRNPPLKGVNKKLRFTVLLPILAAIICVSCVLDSEGREEMIFLSVYCWSLPAQVYMGVNAVAEAYAANIELDSQYLTETEIPHTEWGEREKAIFSEEAREKPWAFVSTNEKHYRQQYGSWGVSVEEVDFENEALIVTFGRKLNCARMLGGREYALDDGESLGGTRDRLYLELAMDYKENMVYFYKVPKIFIYKDAHIRQLTMEGVCCPERFEVQPYAKVIWSDTDYDFYQGFHFRNTFTSVQKTNLFSKWAWAITWVIGG